MEEIEPSLPKNQHPVHKHLWASIDGRVFSAYKGPTSYGRPVAEVRGCKKTSGHRAISIRANGQPRQVTVSQIVWECFASPVPKGYRIDHINNDPTDVRLENLRLATQNGVAQNSGARRNNTSGYKGVSFCRHSGHYQATITSDRRQFHLGRFRSARAAAIAYDKAAIRLHREFARTNAMLGLL